MWYHTYMPRHCLTCSHPRHYDVNRDLIAGDTTVAVAARYGIALATLQRHRNKCLQGGVRTSVAGKRNTAAAIALANLPSREELGGSYAALTKRIDSIVTQAEEQGSLAIAIQGLNSIRANLDSLSRLAGHDSPAVAVQINNAPLDTSVFVAALTAALPDAESRLRFAQAMSAPAINGSASPASPPAQPIAPAHVLEFSDAN